MAEHEEMYRLPGDPPLAPSDLERYRDSNARVTARFTELVRDRLKSSDETTRGSVFWYPGWLPISERESLIELGMRSPSPDIRDRAIDFGFQLPVSVRLALVERGLQDTDEWVRLNAALLSTTLSMDEGKRVWDAVERAIVKGIQSDFDHLYMGTIARLPSQFTKRLEPMITSLLAKSYSGRSGFFRREVFIPLIPFASPDSRASLILPEIQSHGDLAFLAIQRIVSVPESDRAAVVREAIRIIRFDLESDVITERMRGASSLEFLSGSERFALQKLAADRLKEAMGRLRTWQDYHVLEQIARIIPRLHESDQSSLWEVWLESMRQAYVENLNFAGTIDDSRAQPQLPMAQRVALSNMVRETLIGSIDAIRKYCPTKMPSLARRLTDEDSAVVRDGIPDGNVALERLLGGSPLYAYKPVGFFRSAFLKTGSDTTLLDVVPHMEGRSLRDRAIIRAIPTESYVAWRYAYEHAEDWNRLGFDYVPVEPIVRAEIRKAGDTTDVYARVLKGPNARDWLNAFGPHQASIRDQIGRILRGLSELGVEHGHAHEGNFVLLFDRDASGRADISRPPRVYVIDFDVANLQMPATAPLK